MKIINVYNNNIVSSKKNNQEFILVGNGIGFHKRPGDSLDETRIEKIYTFENEQRKQLNALLEKTPLIYFKITEVISRKASEILKVELSSQLLISLSDHICYAVKRKKENVSIPNFMLNEIKVLYKKEFKIGLWALKLIEANLKIKFNEDEAGYIAMHIVNATISTSSQDTNISKILRFIRDVIRIVEKTFDITLNENNISYSRFVTHLKFLGQHMFSGSQDNQENLDHLYTFFIKYHEKMEPCIQQICYEIKNIYHYELLINEQVYLMIHISKLINE
jgi:Transcriptional antiterminator